MADLFIDGGNAFSTYTQPTVSPAPVFAPDAATYATRTAYITAQEFVEAGTGVDVSQLVPAGQSGDQTQALLRVIRQASAWADSLCYKVLAATNDTQAGYFLVRCGICSVPVKNTPALEVTGISTGPTPWQLTPLADLSRVGIASPKIVQFAVPGCVTDPRGRLFVQLSYVNGWTCTTLGSAAALGDTTVTLASNLGVYPGLVLTVDDGAATELVTVDSSYVPGAAGPVPLTAPLASAHAVGVAASAMPPDVKRAVIALTACLIKTRGAEAVVMPESFGGPPTRTALSEAGGIEDFELAADLLEPYRRAA